MTEEAGPTLVQYFIYGLSDPRDGELFYVGRTRNLQTRFTSHKSNWSRHGNEAYMAKMSDIRRAGITPVLNVFEITADASREAFYIEAMFAAGCLLVNHKSWRYSPMYKPKVRRRKQRDLSNRAAWGRRVALRHRAAAHARWHVGRGIHKLQCSFCQQEITGLDFARAAAA